MCSSPPKTAPIPQQKKGFVVVIFSLDWDPMVNHHFSLPFGTILFICVRS